MTYSPKSATMAAAEDLAVDTGQLTSQARVGHARFITGEPAPVPGATSRVPQDADGIAGPIAMPTAVPTHPAVINDNTTSVLADAGGRWVSAAAVSVSDVAAPSLRVVSRAEMETAASASIQRQIEDIGHPAWSAAIRRRFGGRFGYNLRVTIPWQNRRLASVCTWFAMVVVIALSLAVLPTLARVAAESQVPATVWWFAGGGGVVGVLYVGMCWQAVRARAVRIMLHRRRIACCRSVADCVEVATPGVACDVIETHTDAGSRNWGPFLFAVAVFASSAGLIVILVGLAERSLRVAATGSSHVLPAAHVQQVQDFFGKVSISVDYLMGLDLGDVTGAFFVDGVVNLSVAVPFCAQFVNEDIGTGCNLHGSVAPIMGTRPRLGKSEVWLEGLCIGELVAAAGPDGDPRRRPLDAIPVPPPGSPECTGSGAGVCGVTTALTPGQSRLGGNPYSSLLASLPPGTFPVLRVARGPPIMFCHSPDALSQRYQDELAMWEAGLWAWIVVFPLGFMVPRLVAHMLREFAVCGSPWTHHDDVSFELGATGFCINRRLLSSAARRRRQERQPSAFSCGSATRLCALE